jgi:uncharacterized protein YciI
MVIITGKYIQNLDVIDALLMDHRNFLEECYKRSLFICSGPQIPRRGGVIIANVKSVDEAVDIMKSDPFVIHGAVEYQYVAFSPTKYDDHFSCFIGTTREFE